MNSTKAYPFLPPQISFSSRCPGCGIQFTPGYVDPFLLSQAPDVVPMDEEKTETILRHYTPDVTPMDAENVFRYDSASFDRWAIKNA